MKLNVSTIMGILQGANLPATVVKSLSESLEQAAKDESEAVTTNPDELPKYEPIIICTSEVLNDDSPLFILEYDTKEMNHEEAITRFRSVIREHNDNAKNRKRIVDTLGEAFQVIPGTVLKKASMKIKYRAPVIMVKTNNSAKKDQ